MKRVVLLLAVIAIVFSGINAQQRQMPPGMENMRGSISGVITDTESNAPVEYANIAVYSMRDSSLVTGGITDATGKFTISDVPLGRYYVVANFIGYDKQTVNDIRVFPRNLEVDLGNVAIHPAYENIDEVVVTGEKAQIEYKIDRKVVNVSQAMTGAGGTAIEVLENTPSIQTDMDGNVTLRGSSSFTVLIDGKPSILEGSEALQQIPASTIENIEIITSPSAKYDPEGMTGIINVVLKKQKRAGVNGLLDLSAGTDESKSAGLTLNYRTQQFNYFGSINYRDRRRPGFMEMEQRFYNDLGTDFSILDGERNFTRGGSSVKGGFDYYINDMNILTISADYGTFDMDRNADTRYHDYTDYDSFEEYSYNISRAGYQRDYYRFSTNYLLKFDKKGHELLLDATYSDRFGSSNDELYEYLTDANWIYDDVQPDRRRTIEDDESIDFRFKADYTKPFGEFGKLEAGYQLRLESEESQYSVEDLDYSSGNWINDSDLANDLESSRNIQAVYTTFSNKFIGVDYMLGLRGEYTDRLINPVFTTDEYSIERFDIFPTVHLSRQLLNEQQIQASYSKRINRPRDWYLNPFPRYMDDNNIRVGNPDLEPEYVDAVELNYQKRFGRNFISMESYYRQTRNRIQRTRTFTDEGIMISSFENVDKDYTIGLEGMINFDLTKWWTLNLTGNYFYYGIDGELFDEDVNLSTTTWNTRFNTYFKLKWDGRIQFNGMYMGPSITAQGDQDAFFFTSFAYRQNLLKKKLTLTFSVRDIFNTMQHSMTAEGTNFYTYNKFSSDSPIFSLSLSYKINNYRQDRRDRNGDMDMGVDDDMMGR